MPPLDNERWEIACQEWLKDFEDTAAYIRAGFSEGGAKQAAHKFFSRPDVRARCAELVRERTERLKVDAARIVEEIDQLSLIDLTTIFDDSTVPPRMKPIKDWPPDVRRAIGSIKVKRYPAGDHDRPYGEDDWEDFVKWATSPGTIAPWAKRMVEGLARIHWGTWEVVEVKPWSKTSALQMSAMHRGAFSDENTGAPKGTNIFNNIVEVTRQDSPDEWIEKYAGQRGRSTVRGPEGNREIAGVAGRVALPSGNGRQRDHADPVRRGHKAR